MVLRLLCILLFINAKTLVFGSNILTYDHFKNLGIDSVITELKQRKISSVEERVYISRLLANAYTRKGVYKTAIEELTGILESKYYEIQQEEKGLLYIELANAYKFDAQYETAIKYYLKGIDLFKQNKFWGLYCEAHVSVAEYYRKIGGPEKGLEYANKALEIYKVKGLNNKTIYFQALSRKAAIYNEHNFLEKSIEISKKLIDLCVKAGDKKIEATARNELGYSYMNQNKYESANEQFIIAEKIFREKGDLYNAVLALNNRATSCSRAGYPSDYSVGIQRSIIKEVKEHELDYPLEYVYGILSATYVDKQDWDSAIIFQDKYFFSKLRTEHKKYHNKVYEIEASYKNEKIKREKQIVEDVLDKEKELRKTQEKRTLLIQFLLVVVGFLLIVLFWMYYLKRKANKSLVTEINLKELLLKEVNHRVKNNIQMVSSLLSLQSSRAKSKETKIALKEGVSRINALGFAHQELYKNEDFTYIQIDEYMELISSSLCRKTKISININIDSGFKMHVEKAQALGFIVNELITNSIKYAWSEVNESSEIEISAIEENGEAVFLYRDNGIGYTENYSNKKSNSLGSSLIHSFIERQLKGSYRYYSENGAVVEIKFKLENVL